MLGDLVSVELIVGTPTCFNPGQASFKLGFRLWKREKDHTWAPLWVPGIAVAGPVGTGLDHLDSVKCTHNAKIKTICIFQIT